MFVALGLCFLRGMSEYCIPTICVDFGMLQKKRRDEKIEQKYRKGEGFCLYVT